jgi:acyl-coenzyme A thioesterase PaaI-like protein
MHVQFLSSSTDADLVAAGWVTRRGKSIVFCEAEVATTGGKTLAKGALAFKI